MPATQTPADLHTDIVLCSSRKGVSTNIGLESVDAGEVFTVVSSYCVSDSYRCVVLAAMGIRIMAWIKLGDRPDADGAYTIYLGDCHRENAILARAA